MTKKTNNFIRTHLVPLGVSAVILVFVWTRGFGVFVTSGESMNPTLENGDIIFINKIFYDYATVDRYDVIVMRDNDDGGYMVKRVIGLPNETIEIKDGIIYVNQKPTKTTQRIKPNYTNMKPIGIPANCYFYIGDNREDTTWGIVREEDIVGKASIK